MLDKDGNHMEEAKGSGYQAKVKLITPEDMKFDDKKFKIKTYNIVCYP